jgi:hypothetical protein
MISDIIKTNSPLLGRWKLDTTNSTKLKIDMANVDHCGTCTFKAVTKKLEKNSKEYPLYHPKNSLK